MMSNLNDKEEKTEQRKRSQDNGKVAKDMQPTNVKERFAEKSVTAFGLKVFIRPGLPKKERQIIEDTLMEVGCEVVGGNGTKDGSESDISLRVDSVKSRLLTVVAVLRAAKVGEESTVFQKLPAEVVYRVYEDSDALLTMVPAESKKRWWKFW